MANCGARSPPCISSACCSLTLLTLVILPVLYYLFCARLKWIQ
ncbi:MAG: hypothetical protein ACYDC1_09050 [Limisphaerales bacterium]